METENSSMEEIDSDPQPKKVSRKKCPLCGKRVCGRKTLVKHFRQVHCLEPMRKPNLKCTFSEECTFLCTSSELLRNHLKLAHNFKVEKKVITFSTKAEFESWKMEEEVLTNARYVAYTGTKSKSSGKVFYLRCHRSGSVRFDNFERQRAKPEKGYTQCGAICPSTIRVSELPDGTIHVLYYPDHLGHSLDDESVRYMKLSTLERQEILGRLAKGEPVGKIVNDARKRKGGRLSRLNFLQRRDVYNLKKKVIYLEKDDEQDAKMIHAWFKGLNLGSEDSSPIVYYSPLNKYKDYAMIIVHDIQKEVFARAFDGSIIYVKTKKGKPNVDFNLTAVSIVTANGEGFPIAFCVSQKSEYITLYTLYNTVFRIFGLIKPKFFVSDNLCQSYLAWKNVMGECENKLVCIFDLESNWGQKLTQHRVPVFKQSDATLKLKFLLYELNRERFAEELDKTLEEWCEDEGMKSFVCFFQRQYVSKCGEWAGCFRTYMNPHETIDVHLEPINAILDTIYVESYTGLNNALNYLMSYIRDSCLLKVIKWNPNARFEKILATQRNHALGAEIKNIRTNGSEWLFSQGDSDFIVKKVINDCDMSCGIFCSDCNACVHQYSCFCKDYVVGFNLCKHIHAARMAMTRAQELKENMKKMETETLENTSITERKPRKEPKEKKETRKRGEKVEKMKRSKKETPMTGFKHSIMTTAKSLMTDLKISELTDDGYKNITDILSFSQKSVDPCNGKAFEAAANANF